MKKKAVKRSKGASAPNVERIDDESLSTDLRTVLDEISKDAARGAASQWISVQCPYCGENFEVHVDGSEEDQAMQEDCRICCRPIELSVHVEEGQVQVNANRS